MARPICGRCEQEIKPDELYVVATRYTDDLRMLGGITRAVHVDCPPLGPPSGATAVPAFNPLEFITCWRPECAHTASHHGMVWGPTPAEPQRKQGVIHLDNENMACTVEGCECPAFDQGNSTPDPLESIARASDQG